MENLEQENEFLLSALEISLEIIHQYNPDSEGIKELEEFVRTKQVPHE